MICVWNAGVRVPVALLADPELQISVGRMCTSQELQGAGGQGVWGYFAIRCRCKNLIPAVISLYAALKTEKLKRRLGQHMGQAILQSVQCT